MNVFARVAIGCLLAPVLLVGSCAGRIAFDHWRYELPGEVLNSHAAPTATLASGFQIAEALDSYVQPRFEILRDKNFGALRIVYRQHAGIVQLKVDTPEEKAIIANVNAANRDYAVSLLHCAPRPTYYGGGPMMKFAKEPELQLLYHNRQAVTNESDFPAAYKWPEERAEEQKLSGFDAWERQAIATLPELREGKEHRINGQQWDVLMRPVLATKQSCISCHTDAKIGSTLGVMVYAVRKATGENGPVKVSLR